MQEKTQTKERLMKELNGLLKTNYNWNRLNKLDLKRLVNAIKKERGERPALFA